MITVKKYPSRKEVRALFTYCPKSGHLLWNNRQSMRISKGDVAGTIKSNGYRSITINSSKYLAHRLIWIYFNGDIPENLTVDHIREQGSIGKDVLNTKDMNRIENLQLLSMSEQQRKAAGKINYMNPHPGVRRSGSKYMVRITSDGKCHYLGTHETIDEAIEAKREGELKFWGKVYN